MKSPEERRHRRPVAVERWVEALRLGGRSLARSPAFTTMAVLTLGLGIGATTAIFSLANWALLRPVDGVLDADELLSVIPRPAQNPDGIAPLSHPIVRQLIADGPATVGAAAYASVEADVVVDEGSAPLRVQGQVVTPGFFPTLGVRPVRGRAFREEEAGPAPVHAVMVVGHAFWRDVLQGQDVVGRTLDVNGTRFEIVGVAPPGFRGPNRTDRAVLWVPSSATPAVRARLPANVLTLEQVPLWGSLVVRRAAGATADAVREQLTRRAAPELDRQGVRLDVREGFGIPPALRARMADTLVIVGGLVALLLALTVANVVNLVLSRVARRHREAVVRKALGASSLDLAGTLAAEAAVLGAAGAGAAVLVGFGLIELLDGATLLPWIPAIGGVSLDLRVLTFALGAATLATALAGLVAGAGVQRIAPGEALRAGRTVTGGRRSLRRTMVALQVALSLALLVGATLLVRSLSRLQGAELGLDPGQVIVFSLTPGVQGYSDLEADRLFRDLVLELEDDPAIESASFTWMAPFASGRYVERVARPGRVSDEDVLRVEANMVSPGFFADLGIDVIEGRAFDDREYGRMERPERGTVVLNRALADLLFPEGRAVGQQIVMPGRHEAAFEVVGIVENARLADARETAGPILFDPFGNGYRTTRATFVVRGGPAEEVLSRVHATVRSFDSRLPVLDAGPLEAAVAVQLSEERALLRITSAFAALALILSAAGLFGLMAEMVQSRMREFGVRTALGASAPRIVVLVLKDGLLMVGAGTLLGLALGYYITGILSARVAAGIGASDPTSFAVGAAVLLSAALLASLPPALRSARVDPVRSLREE